MVKKGDMKKLSILLILVLFTGCGGKYSTTNKSVNLQDYRNIAVMNFDCPDASAGEKLAGKVAVRFARKGFNVLDERKLKKPANGTGKTGTSLSDDYKAALELNNVRAVVFGSIAKYECEASNAWTWTGFAPEKVEKRRCHASLSLKMVDPRSGETIWEAYDSQSEYARGMTEKGVLGIVLSRIEEEIPAVR